MKRIPATAALAATLALSSPLAAQRSTPELEQLARERLAQLDGQLVVPGLDSAVEVRRDRWGVPHIFAKTERDLFFAQGFVAAQDRLFQMDLWRRIGEGRLAEVFGPAFVARDRFARLLKYRGDMSAEWSSYAPDTREIASNFVRGINAYIAQVRERPPAEFTLLGYAPEPWTPEVPLQRMAALSMTGNAEMEVIRAQLVDKLGAARVNRLLPTIPHRDLDAQPGRFYSGITFDALGAYSEAVGPVVVPRLEGSNNWVVNGTLTASGKPLLANDPHRYLDNPSLRYLTHLVGPGWNVIGAGEPGVPGVAAGHNERIGFGFTIVGMDQQDLYVETLGPCADLPARRCYLHDGAWKPIRVLVDTIAVKGEDTPRIARLEFTEHGPIIGQSDSADAGGRRRAYALRFVGSEPGTAGYLAQLSVDRAHDWPTFLTAAARWKLPTENLIYADVDGNIGWVAAGLMPEREWSGLLPVPGTGGYEWTGFRNADELPKAFNPQRGFIATANHDIRPAGYTVPLNYEFAPSVRARRISAVLAAARDSLMRGQSRRGFTVADFQRLQHDEYSLQASVLVPKLLAAATTAGRAARWEYTTLGRWDYVMRASDAAPLLYEVWNHELSALLLRRLGADPTTADLLGGGSWIDGWESPGAALALVDSTELRSLILAAMDTALVAIANRVGADRTAWRWGAVHTASFRHRLAKAYDPPAVARGGDGSTVNATGGSNLGQQYGASFREIIDFADFDRSMATNVPGQSGQPGSEFYANLLPLWGRGEYFPLVYSRAAIERETSHVLWLNPSHPPKAGSGTR
ncbi:MAG TPA: penicillin acylase family protein [Gemmatimonadaceae bacterium]|nr:penicillin acylase family protein [Gemmatimonadaceae bacterium]